MTPKQVKTEAEWQALVKAHKAVKVTELLGMPKKLDNRAVWFEGQNFGYLFSPRNGEGKRNILAKF